MKRRLIKLAENEKFFKKKDPVKHLKKAKNYLSELIVDNMNLSGSSSIAYTRLCEAQSELNMALKILENESKK